MNDAGFDVSQGDSWVINEVGTPSVVDMGRAVFAGDVSARNDFRDLVRGLYTGPPGSLPAPGAVFAADPSQITTDLADYQQGLRRWYQDEAFWNDMSQYVR